jgi:hypothetical protein
MPRFVITKPLTSFSTEVKAKLINVKSEPLTDASLVRNPQSIGTEYKVFASVVTRKKKSIASVSILPVRKNAGGSFERLVSFEVEIEPVYGSARVASIRPYASSSVLSQGQWYKFGIIQTGIYKIDYASLRNAGIDVDNIDPGISRSMEMEEACLLMRTTFSGMMIYRKIRLWLREKETAT